MTTADEINSWLTAQVTALAPNIVTIGVYVDADLPPHWRVSLLHDLSVGARGSNYDDVLARFKVKLAEGAMPVEQRVKRLLDEAAALRAEAERLRNFAP